MILRTTPSYLIKRGTKQGEVSVGMKNREMSYGISPNLIGGKYNLSKNLVQILG